jgi:hypothetical protein
MGRHRQDLPRDQDHAARIAWMKEHHGLGMNRANMVMSAAFPIGSGWDQPDKLRAGVWKDPDATAIFEALERACTALPDVVTGQRKAFTGFSRNFQFASAKPAKGGQVVLALAVPVDADSRLAEPKAEGWSERLKSKLTLATAGGPGRQAGGADPAGLGGLLIRR